jgi:hypothetical protein
LATCANYIQNRVDNLPHLPFGRASHVVGWKEIYNQHPFGILEVGWVGLAEFGHSPILPNYLRNAL